MKYSTKYQLLNVAEIVPAPYNPREALEPNSAAYAALRQSILEHGLVEPPVVNLYNMHCIGGNQRLTVARDLGYAQVLCSVIRQPDELQEKKLCLSLNRIDGRWDEAKLAALLNDEEIVNYATGFDEAERELYRQLAESQTLEPAAESELLMQIAESSGEDPAADLFSADWAALPPTDLTPEMVHAKIGHLNFKCENVLYQQLLAEIRGAGIFAVEIISQEIKRRLLCND